MENQKVKFSQSFMRDKYKGMTVRKNFIKNTQKFFMFLETEFGFWKYKYRFSKQKKGDIASDTIRYENCYINRKVEISNSYQPHDYGFRIDLFNLKSGKSKLISYVLKEKQDDNQEYLKEQAEALRYYCKIKQFKYMKDTMDYALIFLSIYEESTSLAYILFNVDGIDRSTPRLEELNSSLGWLQAQGLVGKEGKEYFWTEAGTSLYNSIGAKKKKQNIFNQWDTIAKKFMKLPETDFKPEEITEKEVASALRKKM